MPRDNQFLVGLLQGLYSSGVGNPAVNDAREQRKIEQQYKQSQLNQDAAEKGLVPAGAPAESMDHTHPVMQDVLKNVGSFLFPTSGSAPALQTAFKPDPNAKVYGQGPTGETGIYKGQVPDGYAKLPTDKGATLMGEQYRKTSGGKETSFDEAKALATLSGNPNALDNLIAVAQSQGRNSLTKDEMANVYKSFTSKSSGARENFYDARTGQASLSELPSTMAPTTAPGAAYQVKVAARQGKSLIAKPGVSQRMGLSGADLARAITRVAPTNESLSNANFSDSLKTRLSSAMQKITSNPQIIDTPEIRKEIYDIFDEMDKAAEPWISNHMASRKEKGFKDSPDEMNRQLGKNLADIPFDAGGNSAGQGSGGNKPKTVSQGGNTYTLNPLTGKYE